MVGLPELPPVQALEPRRANLSAVGTGAALVSSLARVAPGHTQDEEVEARQKARFVEAVWEHATRHHCGLKLACAEVAHDTSSFPALMTAGQGGTSLLAEAKAFRNYQVWAGKLGRLPGTKKPDSAHWQALVPEYRGSREYVRPGADQFWADHWKIYANENRVSLDYSYDTICQLYRLKYPEIQVPSYAQVRHYYKCYADQKALLIARMGEEWYRNHVAGFIMREAPMVNECWFSDHHIFDAAVRVMDQASGKWRAVRPWLTAWLDWGSLSFVGWSIRVISPNRDVIERSLRLAIERNGRVPPNHIYIDNGKDYKAQGFSRPAIAEQDEVRLATIAELLGSKVHFAIPYNARAKIIERMFRIVTEHFAKFWKSYRGSNPIQRPEAADAEWQNPENLPTLEDFTAAFALWIEHFYDQTASDGDTLKGATPALARAKFPRVVRPAMEADSIYKAFLRELPGKPRDVMRGGIVRALNRFYRSDSLFQLLRQVKQVRVKVDPDDISVVWIYTLDGREVGPAKEIRSIPGLVDPEDATNIEALREEQKRHNRQIGDAKRLAREMAKFSGDPIRTLFPPTPAAAVQRVRSAPAPAASAEDLAGLAELDAVLEAKTQANHETLFGAGRTDDQDDEAMLAELERLKEERA